MTEEEWANLEPLKRAQIWATRPEDVPEKVRERERRYGREYSGIEQYIRQGWLI